MKKVVELIKELKKTPRGKGILFFTFYFFFFLALAILARLIPGNTNINYQEEEKEDVISISNINGYNYSYTYTINIDQNSIVINGKKNGEVEEFTLNNIKYTKNGTLYYKDGVNTVIPNEYLEYIDNIDLLLSYSMYDSVVNYKSGKEILRYQISSSTISNIFDKKDLDLEEIPNEIRLTKNTDDYINEVEIVLDSYCTALSRCNKNMSIKMTYSDFNNIGEITTNIE